MKNLLTFKLAILLAFLGGCSFAPPYVPDAQPIASGRLTTPNKTANIQSLRSCTDAPDSTLKFNSDEPMTVLVHGCNGSAGRFRSLAQLYAFHGQQAVCFSYDDRDSLIDSADQLITALDKLAKQTNNKNINVIGHSMGGLIARKAMEQERSNLWSQKDLNINLITVSAPLNGIEVANPCGAKWLQWLSLGTVPGICWMISGDNWHELTSHSSFIQQPGPLLSSVQRYLKVVTDEHNTCRYRRKDGSCLVDDFIFSLPEQYHPIIDRYSNLTNVEVKAGHVEIVGHQDVAPRKLLSILQNEGMLAPTPPERKAAFEKLLAELY
jgi:pimeloyl-ACP methyl ester carboxylesterase